MLHLMNESEQNAPAERDEGYVLHIDNFDGPLDLLWGLIKKAKIDITEVSISQITEQYIAYLRLMEELNIQVASDFILMASELLYYKSRALLPGGEMEDEYFVPPLPPELIQKLLEYKNTRTPRGSSGSASSSRRIASRGLPGPPPPTTARSSSRCRSSTS
jgi:hypothetical protein